LTTAEFDKIADVYDDTRGELHKDTIDGMARMFEVHRCHSLLEIAIGTGRVALPLTGRGFSVTGVDVSRRMMEKALSKGIRDLFLAEGSLTPFRDGGFDGVLMVHVLHILEDPLSVLREAARVSSIGVFALLRKREGNRGWGQFFGMGGAAGDENRSGANPDADPETIKLMEERRERFRKIAEKYGWTRDPSIRARNWRVEQDILVTHPPDELEVVSDVVVTESLDERISRFEKGAFSFMSTMPEAMRKELAEAMRADSVRLPTYSQDQPRHQVYQVAFWRSNRFLNDDPSPPDSDPIS
jgi:SAM-dependent methyltransferase